MNATRTAGKTVAAAALGCALTLAAPSVASAEVLSGWTGATPPNSQGVAFLHNSTVINSPSLVAQSKIWTVLGQDVAPGDIGVRAQLFKSGALCEAVDYRYNIDPTPELTIGTSGHHCGSGFYNSHGFVAVWNGTSSYNQYITFPSNPLQFTDPTQDSARSATPQALDIDSGVNGSGQSYGPGDTATTDDELPDLVAAIGTDGTLGYISRDALHSPAPNPAATDALPRVEVDGVGVRTTGGRTVPLYAADGDTVVGQFHIS